MEHVHEEIADVLIYCIMLSDRFGFDLDDIILDKLSKNARKYPIEISRGNSKKAR
ncbi:MazG-like family protein [Bifidobacterium adolescentis]|uniref:MazG-like family protein n=1 Tax=Bifidobacterium adolescentis TaxID=1680 RepID=UPI003A4D77DB